MRVFFYNEPIRRYFVIILGIDSRSRHCGRVFVANRGRCGVRRGVRHYSSRHVRGGGTDVDVGDSRGTGC